jgi:hypothetical protein
MGLIAHKNTNLFIQKFVLIFLQKDIAKSQTPKLSIFFQKLLFSSKKISIFA